MKRTRRRALKDWSTASRGGWFQGRGSGTAGRQAVALTEAVEGTHLQTYRAALEQVRAKRQHRGLARVWRTIKGSLDRQ